MSKVVLYESTEGHAAPHRAHSDDVGYDMASLSFKVDKENQYTTIDLGTRVAFPGGYWGQIHARSSLADKGWRLVNSVGIIDSGYRGPLKAKLEKRHAKAESLEEGQVYVQLVIYPNPFVAMKVGKVSKDTERGEGGFGSTTRKKAATLDEVEETPKRVSKKKAVASEEEDEPPKRVSKKKAVASDDEDEPPKRVSKKKAEEVEETPKRASKKKAVSSDDEDEPPKRASRKKAVASDDEEPPRVTKKKAARGKASAEDE